MAIASGGRPGDHLLGDILPALAFLPVRHTKKLGSRHNLSDGTRFRGGVSGLHQHLTIKSDFSGIRQDGTSMLVILFVFTYRVGKWSA